MFQRGGVFSQFSWSLDFDAKMAEYPLPVPQIGRSRKGVAIQIQLMNIHVSECKYYCLHLVPKFGDVRDRQNWWLHPTDQSVGCSCQFWRSHMVCACAGAKNASNDCSQEIFQSLWFGTVIRHALWLYFIWYCCKGITSISRWKQSLDCTRWGVFLAWLLPPIRRRLLCWQVANCLALVHLLVVLSW